MREESERVEVRRESEIIGGGQKCVAVADECILRFDGGGVRRRAVVLVVEERESS